MADPRHELLAAFLLALRFLHRTAQAQRHLVELRADRRKFVVAIVNNAVVQIASANLLHTARENIQRLLNLAKNKARQKMVRQDQRDQDRSDQNNRHDRQHHFQKICGKSLLAAIERNAKMFTAAADILHKKRAIVLRHTPAVCEHFRSVVERFVMLAFSTVLIKRFPSARHNQTHRVVIQQRRQPIQPRQTRRIVIRRQHLRRHLHNALASLVKILLIVKSQTAANRHRQPHQRQAEHPSRQCDPHRHQDHQKV